jgi:hypothetical protein
MRTSPALVAIPWTPHEREVDGVDLVEKLIERAEKHGQESEPCMQVGDLEEALRIVWKVLTPSQRRRAFEEILAHVFEGA